MPGSDKQGDGKDGRAGRRGGGGRTAGKQEREAEGRAKECTLARSEQAEGSRTGRRQGKAEGSEGFGVGRQASRPEAAAQAGSGGNGGRSAPARSLPAAPQPGSNPQGAAAGRAEEGCVWRPSRRVSYLTARPWLRATGRHKLHLPGAAAAGTGGAGTRRAAAYPCRALDPVPQPHRVPGAA